MFEISLFLMHASEDQQEGSGWGLNMKLRGEIVECKRNMHRVHKVTTECATELAQHSHSIRQRPPQQALQYSVVFCRTLFVPKQQLSAQPHVAQALSGPFNLRKVTSP